MLIGKEKAEYGSLAVNYYSERLSQAVLRKCVSRVTTVYGNVISND